ncbi:MAG: SPASM domain-containing protein [Anaerolineae bacterium]
MLFTITMNHSPTPRFLKKINQARHLLPKAKLALYSNGDYLTQEVLGQLAELGVDETRVTLYPSASHAFDKPSTARMISFLNRLSIDVASKDICETSKRIEVRIDFQGTELHIIVPHIQLYTDRGGAVPLEELTLQTVRTQPCFLPSLSAAIDYQGNLKLCCQIYDATLPANQQYIIGNVADEGFMQLWFSEKMEMFRRRLSTADFEGLDACTHCTHALSLYQRQALNERA